MSDASAVSDTLRVGYFVWFYPVLSMTFVQREVAALRARGAEVLTMAVRHPPLLHSETERQSARETWTIEGLGRGKAILDALKGLLRDPGCFLSTLLYSIVEGWCRRSDAGVAKHLRYFGGAVLLAERLRSVEIDHLHVHMGDVGADVARIVAKLERNRRRPRPFTWSMTVHGPDELLHPGRYKLRQKVEDADLVIAISEYARSQLVAMVSENQWSKIHVVHCGLDFDRWPGRTANRGSGPLRVLCVGRLQPQKGHSVLLMAAALLRDRGIDFEMTLAGDGPERGDIETRINCLRLGGRVRLIGAVGQSNIPSLFPRFDVFCLASVSEGLPVVLMEAMATGLPVVTTRITGIPELVEDNVSGLLVPPARPDQLASALERIHRDAALRQRLAVAGKAAVSKGFRIQDSAMALEEHFRGVRGDGASTG